MKTIFTGGHKTPPVIIFLFTQAYPLRDPPAKTATTIKKSDPSPYPASSPTTQYLTLSPSPLSLSIRLLLSPSLSLSLSPPLLRPCKEESRRCGRWRLGEEEEVRRQLSEEEEGQRRSRHDSARPGGDSGSTGRVGGGSAWRRRADVGVGAARPGGVRR